MRDLPATERDSRAWDAWRRPDGRWTVVAAVGDSAPLSTWIYDPRSRSVQPDDAAAHRIASENVVVPLRSTTSTVAIERETPAVDEPEAPPAAVAVDDETPDESSAPEPEAEDLPPTTSRGKARKSRRASVPRWDEILFGAGQSDA